MKLKSTFKKAICIGTLAAAVSLAAASSHISTQSHQAAVSALAVNKTDQSFFTAGNDGFLIKWTNDGLGEHYQLSELEIRLVALHPNGTDIAVYETDGYSVHRVSVWNWQTLTRKFVKTFENTVTALSFTAKGTLLAVGTATVNGVVYLNPQRGTVVSKIKEPTGIVNMIHGSSSEKSAVMYSPAGHLTYYDMTKGTRKTRFQTEQQLEQVVLFSSSLFCAGVKNNQIHIIDALNGNIVARIAAKSPMLFNSPDEAVLYYTEFDGRTYTLKMIASELSETGAQIQSPVTVKSFTGPRGKDAVTSVAKSGETLILATKTGNVYTTDSLPSANTLALVPLTDNMYDKIYDIAAISDDFYCLTSNSIFKTSYDTGIVETVGSNNGYTNLIPYENGLILWTKGTRKEIAFMDLETKAVKSLFTPQTYVQMLRLFNDKLIFIEGNTAVNLYDITGGTQSKLYTGTGLQDAVLYNDTDLFVAKSASSNPRSPLINVNTQTKETVMLPVSGNVAFSLSYDAAAENAPIYGINVSTAAAGTKTTIFAYYPARKTVASIMMISDEDTDAFTSLYGSILYTNIGRDQIRSYDVKTRREVQLNRSASLPLKITRNEKRVAVLNRDGSISWYNPGSGTVLADWYMTVDGMWFEF
ncbi:WD40 repeat domain-containing protein [Treponema brennaborense]|uniref:WD40 repeat domain-containing protein n=1 Tax=Treponema brennaborense (strain DSM 12168 / CIP 105900 / DD5/3) TaxID=906968 RepID=F4LN86_TREBD|nr:WD40 repeat domain-containing protein [Treponema brennaborense]AEE16851.1 hypothetical protein Trebr_1427 [Treponema brennaborense DSM 12168]